jgi:Asp/Glu/hydantoin racemase
MVKILVCIHTVQPLLGVFDFLSAEILPGIKVMHILDEPLLARIGKRGQLDTEDIQRIQTHRELAKQIGAEAVLVTCSSVSPCVDDVRELPGIPIYKIDEAMIHQAVTLGRRIGVVATAETTLEPTRKLLATEADRQNKRIQTELVLVPDALQSLLSGDSEKHDSMVKQSVLDIGERVDVIVLAQASMARVLDAISDSERQVPILSSPHLALEVIRNQLVLHL